MSILSGFELRPANAEDMDTIYKIRYKAYLLAGLIGPSPTKKFNDIYDAAGRATTFALSHGKKLIGTARYVADSRIGLPMDDEGFGSCLTILRQAGRRFVEAGRLAMLPEYQSRSRELSLHLCLYTISCALMSGYDDMVIMVANHHAKFYEKVLMFETLVSDHVTSYCKNSYSLRLNLKKLMQRYEGSRTARRFGLPNYLRDYQAMQLREQPNASQSVFN
jgi:hypothetical protein